MKILRDPARISDSLAPRQRSGERDRERGKHEQFGVFKTPPPHPSPAMEKNATDAAGSRFWASAASDELIQAEHG
jgi:hypothetical protein